MIAITGPAMTDSSYFTGVRTPPVPTFRPYVLPLTNGVDEFVRVERILPATQTYKFSVLRFLEVGEQTEEGWVDHFD